jgi:P-type Cu2+ transporter
MIGDGANDSLAFNASLCTGTPAIDRGLLERKADFYFLGRGLRGIRTVIEIARRKQRADRQVLSFAISYNAIAVALCIAGKMTPLLAAILMPLSGLVTIGLVLATMRK